jgi:hypothetical protein
MVAESFVWVLVVSVPVCTGAEAVAVLLPGIGTPVTLSV